MTRLDAAGNEIHPFFPCLNPKRAPLLRKCSGALLGAASKLGWDGFAPVSELSRARARSSDDTIPLKNRESLCLP